MPNDIDSQDTLNQALLDIEHEMHRAIAEHNWFNSEHEGYAVILEELDELWEAIKENEHPTRLREEAIQVAAMALEFATQYGRQEYQEPPPEEDDDNPLP